MKNKLLDLNNHLFAQLEKLCDENVKGPHLEEEIRRANAMANISNQIISAAAVSVNAMRLVASGNIKREELPLLLNAAKNNQ